MRSRRASIGNRISIHALRVEGDFNDFSARLTAAEISIHALRVEGDTRTAADNHVIMYFYPRPPGGGRLHELEDLFFGLWISIHALRVEGDFRALA